MNRLSLNRSHSVLSAPEGSQRVPPPPTFPEAPNCLLYGFELTPELFGPGKIAFQFHDGSNVVFDQPDTNARADYVFWFVAHGMGMARSMSIEQPHSLSPPIVYFAKAQKDFGLHSFLNYDDAIPSSATLRELAETLHLLKEPEWIDTSRWITPEWLERVTAIYESIPPLVLFASVPVLTT